MVEEVESSLPPHPLLQALRDITEGRGGVEGGGGWKHVTRSVSAAHGMEAWMPYV
jgi:hypothetical protein